MAKLTETQLKNKFNRLMEADENPKIDDILQDDPLSGPDVETDLMESDPAELGQSIVAILRNNELSDDAKREQILDLCGLVKNPEMDEFQESVLGIPPSNRTKRLRESQRRR